jgi:hypothetical protein
LLDVVVVAVAVVGLEHIMHRPPAVLAAVEAQHLEFNEQQVSPTTAL